jgi:hypothetical protein
LYIYDFDKREPVYFRIFPGSTIDKSNVIDLLTDLNIKGSTLTFDIGFNSEKDLDLYENKGVFYLTPLNRNSHYTKLTKILDNFNKVITYNEIQLDCVKYKLTLFEKKLLEIFRFESDNSWKLIEDNKKEGKEYKGTITRYLYAYLNGKIAEDENQHYLKLVKEGEMTHEKYNEDKKTYGTICFISNIEKSLEDIYDSYEYRWTIETFTNTKKKLLDQDLITVRNENSTYGYEYINFIADIMRCRFEKKIKEVGIKSYSLCNILRHLNNTRVVRRNNKWTYINCSNITKNIMQMLNLETETISSKNYSEYKIERVKRKRGRPQKVVIDTKDTLPREMRKVGRPKKILAEGEFVVVKVSKPRGRPKKIIDPNNPVVEKIKRGRGRPKLEETPEDQK